MIQRAISCGCEEVGSNGAVDAELGSVIPDGEKEILHDILGNSCASHVAREKGIQTGREHAE